MLQVFRTIRALRTPLVSLADFRRVIGDLPGTAAFVGRYLRGKSSLTPPKSMWLLSMCEQAPNPDSRVMLSDQRDPLGMLRIRLDWRLTELDRRTAEMTATSVRDEFSRLGIAQVKQAAWLSSASDWRQHLSGAFHPTGTTRMSVNPGDGVVDANCRVHGTANLYVGGSSVFPTSGYANPTLTIVALAIRTADTLKSALQ
jgi:choline dehydrogenase-like flavoprotein